MSRSCTSLGACDVPPGRPPQKQHITRVRACFKGGLAKRLCACSTATCSQTAMQANPMSLMQPPSRKSGCLNHSGNP